MLPAASLPSPVFEGSEKRLSVDFYTGDTDNRKGLRALERAQLDALLTKAACTIISTASSDDFDAYVLSESSMMVYSTRLVLKTCGTTRLLDAVPCLLELAESLGMPPRRCKYSRASYLFPDLQPDLYRCFTKESKFLDTFFGHLGGEGGSYILGDSAEGLQWHIYVADAEAAPVPVGPSPTYSLEICMTGLCPQKMQHFVKGEGFDSAPSVTVASGIGSLLDSKAKIDDYVFEPCGYSMNGLEDSAFCTIHVTPEEAFSYASLEFTGYPAHGVDSSRVLKQAVEIFGPSRITISLSVDEDVPACKWVEHLEPPVGYSVQGSIAQRFACGGCVVHHNLAHDVKGKPEGPVPSSPSTVLDNAFALLTGDDSDRDGSSRSTTPSSPWASPTAATAGVAATAPPADLQKVLAVHKAAVLDSGAPGKVEQHMAELIAVEKLEDPLYIIDLGRVVRLYEAWTQALPRVTPFYAVKCLTDDAVIATLAALGCGFDCASEFEMSAVLDLGVPPERIVLANACKRPKDLRAAVKFGVDLTTFDTESELQKLANMHLSARALLRIRADDLGARCILGNKYGAEPYMIPSLLKAARKLGVRVVGVSFHVGSLATNPHVFGEAIKRAREIFDEGQLLGFEMDTLDIGGGFSSSSFSLNVTRSIPAAVNKALDAHFPTSCGVKIISEPGRYFAEDATTLACMIFGVRTYDAEYERSKRDYWITDGLYGSMNSIMYDHAVLANVHPLERHDGSAAGRSSTVLSTVFGPTCDGLDVVLSDCHLPIMENGDWLVFPNMGAYTMAGACNFNGMGVTAANARYVYSLSA